MANGTMLLGHSLFIHKDKARQATEIGGDSPGLTVILETMSKGK